jgi:CubicO group peptidase (beta-lactamase class C family)
VTATTDALTEAVHAATRAAARRRIGLAVGAFAGPQTVVHTTGLLPDTAVDLRPDQLTRKAAGHSRRGRVVPDWHLGAMPGAGALYSTVPDLLTLLRAHLEPDGTTLRDALGLVQRPRARRNRWLQVGLGWFLSPVRSTGHTALWHNGGTGGFAGYLALLPAAEAGVVVLADTARSVDRAGVRLLASLAGSTGFRP